MRFRRRATDTIARDRLRMMVETGAFECSPEQMAQMKKEIAEIVSRYVHMEPEDYELRILLKQKQKQKRA